MKELTQLHRASSAQSWKKRLEAQVPWPTEQIPFLIGKPTGDSHKSQQLFILRVLVAEGGGSRLPATGEKSRAPWGREGCARPRAGFYPWARLGKAVRLCCIKPEMHPKLKAEQGSSATDSPAVVPLGNWNTVHCGKGSWGWGRRSWKQTGSEAEGSASSHLPEFPFSSSCHELEKRKAPFYRTKKLVSAFLFPPISLHLLPGTWQAGGNHCTQRCPQVPPGPPVAPPLGTEWVHISTPRVAKAEMACAQEGSLVQEIKAGCHSPEFSGKLRMLPLLFSSHGRKQDKSSTSVFLYLLINKPLYFFWGVGRGGGGPLARNRTQAKAVRAP